MGWKLKCHMPTRSSGKDLEQKYVTFAKRVAITNRGMATMTDKVLDLNTISLKAMGQKEKGPKAMGWNIRVAKETRIESTIPLLRIS